MLMSAHSAARAIYQATETSSGWFGEWVRSPWVYPAGIGLVLLCIVFYKKLRDLPANLRAREKSTLDPTQLEELMIGTPPQIVDLRPKEEYEGKHGHIRGALNIPYSEFKKRIDELDTSHPRPIVLVDENDVLSHEAMPLLEQRGHRWLYVLKGGFRAWRRAKYPVYFTPQKPAK